jgi:Plavaka transposase
MHGAMFVCVVAGSDKTIAFTATGHQEFHPLYVGPGNIDNLSQQAHGIGLLPCTFLPIPKGMFQVHSFSEIMLISLKPAKRSKQQLHISNFAINYITSAWLIFTHHSNWQ